MNLDQFKDWIKLHSGLLKIFNDLFHQDLWRNFLFLEIPCEPSLLDKHRFTKQSSSGVSIRSMNEISSAATTTSLRESRILDVKSHLSFKNLIENSVFLLIMMSMT